MRIIDEKGRIFGKINVIDFLVLLILLFFVPLFYFGYKTMTKTPATAEREFIEIETYCKLIKLKPEDLKLISVGDKELNENGQVIGEIISLSQSKAYKYGFDIGKEQKIIKEHPVLKQIESQLKLTAEAKEGKLYYKDREIRVGSPLEFKTNKYSIMAIPYEEEERRIDLNVTLKNLDEDTLKKISVEDKEVDENGETIAEIISLGEIETSYTSFDIGRESLIRAEDKNKKQISTRMRLKCQVREGNQLYFKGNKIAYNTPLEFKTDKYEIIGFPSEDYSPYRKESWISLKVKFSRVVPEIAEVVKKGDVEKDAFGKTVARISSIISNEPALVAAINDEGVFVTPRHPFERDIIVSLGVLCEKKEGSYYFKNNLAKMGNEINFMTDIYSISGMIIGIETK